MCFQRLLKKQYGMIKRSNNIYLYVTSNLGIKFEEKYARDVLNLSKALEKIYYSCSSKRKYFKLEKSI